MMYGVGEDKAVNTFFEAKANLYVRFDNRDVYPGRVESVQVTLITTTNTVSLKIYSHLDGQVGEIEDLTLAIREKTKEFWLDCAADINIGWKEQLDETAYLRVTMNAVGQDPNCVDLVADWQKAWEGPQVPFTVRAAGYC